MTEATPRGRPRQYDPEEALAAALNAFRQRGYTATSLDHLSEATGMKRPSLYAAFGNKRDIYLKAVERFRQNRAREHSSVLFGERPLVDCIEAHFDAVITSYAPPDDAPLGCPVLCVIAAEAPTDAEINAELVSTIRRIDATFRKHLQMAQAAGELPAQADVKGLAMLLGGLQHSLALRARAGTKRQDLMRFARTGIAHLLNELRHSPREPERGPGL